MLSGLERGAAPILQGSCEQGTSPLSPALPLPGRVSGQPPPRQAHQPGAASHMLSSTCAQERCCTLGKVRSAATFARADNSTVLTHSASRQPVPVTRGKKAVYKTNGSGGAGDAEPQCTATSVSCSKRRRQCTAERWALLLWRKPHSSLVTRIGSLAAFSRGHVVMLFRAVTFQSA